MANAVLHLHAEADHHGGAGLRGQHAVLFHVNELLVRLLWHALHGEQLHQQAAEGGRGVRSEALDALEELQRFRPAFCVFVFCLCWWCCCWADQGKGPRQRHTERDREDKKREKTKMEDCLEVPSVVGGHNRRMTGTDKTPRNEKLESSLIGCERPANGR